MPDEWRTAAGLRNPMVRAAPSLPKSKGHASGEAAGAALTQCQIPTRLSRPLTLQRPHLISALQFGANCPTSLLNGYQVVKHV